MWPQQPRFESESRQCRLSHLALVSLLHEFEPAQPAPFLIRWTKPSAFRCPSRATTSGEGKDPLHRTDLGSRSSSTRSLGTRKLKHILSLRWGPQHARLLHAPTARQGRSCVVIAGKWCFCLTQVPKDLKDPIFLNFKKFSSDKRHLLHRPCSAVSTLAPGNLLGDLGSPGLSVSLFSPYQPT